MCVCAFRTLPRNTNGKFSIIFLSTRFHSAAVAFSVRYRCCFFNSVLWATDAQCRCLRPQTTTDVCRQAHFHDRQCISHKKRSASYTHSSNAWRMKKRAAQVNLLKMFIPIHLSGAMLRFYHHRCVTAIFFPYILHSHCFGWVFFSQLAKTKEPYHRCRSVVHFFSCSLLTPSLNKCTHTMCNEWQLYPSYPFLSVWCGSSSSF